MLSSMSLISFSITLIFLVNCNSCSFNFNKLLLIALLFTSYFCLSIVICFSLFKSFNLLVIFNSASLLLFILSSISKFLSFIFSNSTSISVFFNPKICSFSTSILFLVVEYLAFKSDISFTINAISISSNSFFNSIYFFATLLCFSSGKTVFDSSSIINLNLVKFSSVFSNFFKLSSFLFLYFKTPAALSNIVLLSVGLPLTISVTFPWDIILNAPKPAPESIKRFVMSFNLTLELFI